MAKIPARSQRFPSKYIRKPPEEYAEIVYGVWCNMGYSEIDIGKIVNKLADIWTHRNKLLLETKNAQDQGRDT